ncbi:ATP-binding protein, partial [Methylobacterium haplocladii]
MTSRDDGGGDRLARALAPYLTPDPACLSGILLAVSGGPDSTALMHAAACAGSDIALWVATVDHGLRPE